MKTSIRFLQLLAIICVAISCTHLSNDDMLGSYKGLSKGMLFWSKTNVGIPDASIDSKEERVLNFKKNEKGEFYFENKNGVVIKVTNATSIADGITFNIPKQMVRGTGEDSTTRSELAGLMEYTLGGTKCDGYFDRKNNTVSLSFAGTLIVKVDTAILSVPFNTSYPAFPKVKEGGK